MLEKEFPELAKRISVNLPDEKAQTRGPVRGRRELAGAEVTALHHKGTKEESETGSGSRSRLSVRFTCGYALHFRHELLQVLLAACV